jgi:dTDP-4-amino-4,6-dideoxygalactose transaminase
LLKILLSQPDICDEDISLMNQVVRSGKLVQGEYVSKLEEIFRFYHHSTFAIAVSNATAALHLCLKVLDIKEGDEVIVPAFSYIATANVVELVGATPVFVDIEDTTFNINPELIKECITTRTKAIIPVHEFGLACDINKVCETVNTYQFPVIEDAACSLGSKQNNNYTGTFGLMGCFSLHPRKSITSGEGGVIVTGNWEMREKLLHLRNHGISYTSGRIDFVDAGYNYRLTDFQAALAYSQFKRLNIIIDYKSKLAEIYLSEIKNPKITLPFLPSDRNHTWQTFHVLLDETLDQSTVIEQLKQYGIETNIGAQCIPAQTYFQNKYRLNSSELFPNAWKAYTKGLALPLHTKLPEPSITVKGPIHVFVPTLTLPKT